MIANSATSRRPWRESLAQQERIMGGEWDGPPKEMEPNNPGFRGAHRLSLEVSLSTVPPGTPQWHSKPMLLADCRVASLLAGSSEIKSTSKKCPKSQQWIYKLHAQNNLRTQFPWSVFICSGISEELSLFETMGGGTFSREKAFLQVWQNLFRWM